VRAKTKQSAGRRSLPPIAQRGGGATAPRNGQALQRQQLHEMTLCAPEELFFCDSEAGEVPAPIFDASDFGPLATGICVMSVTKAREQVLRQQKEELFSSPCAILCACVPADWATLHTSKNRHVIARFQPEQCSPFFVGTSKVPRQEKCMLFQFGSEHVAINDQAMVNAVKGDIAEHVKSLSAMPQS